VQALVSRIEDRRVITYGENPQADVRYSNHHMDGPVSVFDVVIHSRNTGAVVELKDLRLPMPGKHNVSNAVAAIAVAHELGLTPEQIAKGLAQFGGVKRRFTNTGSWNGVEIFDDYGHHPVEIKAVLSAARDACQGRVIAVAQPHRYTRLESLFDDFAACFNDANTVIMAPVYAAGEDPIPGASREDLVKGLIAHGHRHAVPIFTEDDLTRLVRAETKPGDIVVCLGAGTISTWANALPARLRGAAA
jgi:UDP-N-acetylmuramate--alanine ligase